MTRGNAASIEPMHQDNQRDHARSLSAFVTESLASVTQCNRSVGNTWDQLHVRRGLRDPNARIYEMCAEVLIEVKVVEEQDGTAKIVTGASSSTMKPSARPSARDHFANASQSKAQKGKGRGKQQGKTTWPAPCQDYLEPDGCSLGHNCPKHHPGRQIGRCTIYGSTKHYTSNCRLPVKPKTKSVEYNEDTYYHEDDEAIGFEDHRDTYEAQKGKQGKGKKALNPKATTTSRPQQTQFSRQSDHSMPC